MDVSPQLPALESLKLAKEVASPHVALVPSCASDYLYHPLKNMVIRLLYSFAVLAWMHEAVGWVGMVVASDNKNLSNCLFLTRVQ